MRQTVSAFLENQGVRNIGFPSGNFDEVIHSNGDGKLWCAFRLATDAASPRYWNAFGVFDSRRPAQIITVEINVSTTSNSVRVAGFFARDPASGRIYLMHDGSVGGGRRGVGRTAFLAWSKTTLVEVARTDAPARSGIIVADVGATDLPSRLWRFVQLVRDFKDTVTGGQADDEELRLAAAEWETFNNENSGRRRGTRNAENRLCIIP